MQFGQQQDSRTCSVWQKFKIPQLQSFPFLHMYHSTFPPYLSLSLLLSDQSACREGGRGRSQRKQKQNSVCIKFSLCIWFIVQPCTYASIIKLLTLFMHTWQRLFSNLQPHIQHIYYAIVLTLFILNLQNIYIIFLYTYLCLPASS